MLVLDIKFCWILVVFLVNFRDDLKGFFFVFLFFGVCLYLFSFYRV